MKVVKNNANFSKRSEVCQANRKYVYIDGNFAINVIQPNILSLLLTGKFRSGLTERVCLKRVFTNGESTVNQRLFIA